LPANVTAITFCQYVFPHLFDGSTGNNVITYRRLDSNIKHLAWNKLFKLLSQLAAAALGKINMADNRQRIDAFAVNQNIDPLHIRGLKAFKGIIQRGITAAG